LFNAEFHLSDADSILGSVHMEFVVEKAALGQVISEYFRFLYH
jgi:hypothetical protein